MDRRELAWRLRTACRAGAQRVRFAVNPPRWRRRALAAALDRHVLGAAAAALESHRWDDAHRMLQHHFATRAQRFVLDPARRTGLTEAISERYPSARADAADRGDRLVAGLRDLLGFRGLQNACQWHRDPVNGRESPMWFWSDVPYLSPSCGDHKVIWELNRHQHWMSLGRAYWLSGDPRYRQLFMSELRSWLDANPPLAGINWASMLELAFRSLSWTWALHFFAEPHADDPQPWTVDLLLALDRQLNHVEQNLSIYFSPNTHLLGEALALYVTGRAVPELRESARRAARGRDILLAEAGRQICGDGGHCERSTHYHRYALDFYLLALASARVTGDEAATAFAGAVARLADAARLMADRDGRVPHIGDDDGGMLLPLCGRAADDWRDSLAVAAVALGRPELQIGDLPEETWWVLGTSAVHAARSGTAPGSGALPDTGFYVSRSPAHHMIIDGGPHGFLNGGHAHADALAITLSIDSRPLLIDPGTGCYTIHADVRERFRSTAAHNTLVLDDRPQSQGDGPFHWATAADARPHQWATAPQFDFFDGSHNGYAPHIHRRRVLVIHGEWLLVVDHVDGDGRHRAAIHWHLAEEWRADVVGRLVHLEAPGSSTRLAVSGGGVEVFAGDRASGLGWHSPVYGIVRPTATVRIAHEAAAPFAIATAVDLRRRASLEAVDLLPVWAAAGTLRQAAGFRLRSARVTDYVLVADAHPDVRRCWRLAGLETDASMLTWRVGSGGALTRLALVDGSYVRSVGRGALDMMFTSSAGVVYLDETALRSDPSCAASPAS